MPSVFFQKSHSKIFYTFIYNGKKEIVKTIVQDICEKQKQNDTKQSEV